MCSSGVVKQNKLYFTLLRPVQTKKMGCGLVISLRHCAVCASSMFQDDWNGAVANKLRSIKPVLGDWHSSYRRCRKDDKIVLCHTHLTQSHILRKDPPPLCEHCQCILTLRHILVECNHFVQRKERYIWKKRCGRII